jgi:hypothetical protein
MVLKVIGSLIELSGALNGGVDAGTRPLPPPPPLPHAARAKTDAKSKAAFMKAKNSMACSLI